MKELQEALTAYLRRATETFDLSKNVEVKGDFHLGATSPHQIFHISTRGKLFCVFYTFGTKAIKNSEVPPIPPTAMWAGPALIGAVWHYRYTPGQTLALKGPLSGVGLALIGTLP